jgi:multidrug efflux pump subunit AcrA (membrane-fusion protein)
MDVSLLNQPKTDSGESKPTAQAESGVFSDVSVANPYTPGPDSAGPRWWFFNMLLPSGILVLGGLLFFLLGTKSVPTVPAEDQRLAARTERLPSVDTLPVRPLEAVGGRLNLKVDGEVVPFREVQIATEVSGQIVYKDEVCQVGSFVSEGRLLFRIDPADYQNEVDRLTKSKEQEYQAIREMEQELVNTKRLVDVATLELELQDKEVARLKSLPKGFASQSELDQAQRARLQSMNNKVTLENQIDLMRQRRTRLEAAEQLAETQLQMARKNLERTEIRSPISGVIFREDAELNSFVQRGEVIITIEDTSKAEIVTSLRSDQLYWVLDQQRGANASDAADSDSSVPLGVSGEARDYSLPKTEATIHYAVAGRDNEVYEWKGVLERYDGIGFDKSSRTVPVRVMVDQPRRMTLNSETGESQRAINGPSALVRGMFVSVILHVQPRKPLVVLPAVALKPGTDGNRLWKFSEDPTVLDLKDPLPATSAGSQSDGNDGASNKSPDTRSDEGVSTETPTTEGTGTPFDQSKWAVGRVDVISQVRPIESYSLPEASLEDGKLALGSNGKATYWVCEIGDGDLTAGDRLIVSPLSSFEGDGKDAVRVPIEQLSK